MLKLRYNTADWREELLAAIDYHESKYDVELEVHDYDEIADELRERTLDHLSLAGVGYGRAMQQSHGPFVIVQSGTPEEINAFCAALEEEMLEAEEQVEEMVKAIMEV